MQITSANSFTAQTSASQAVESSARSTEQSERLTARPDKQAGAGQESSNQQQPTRFDVDQQAIAQLEQERQFNDNPRASTGYDRPSQANQTAISAYQSVDHIAQRESIQQTFGVDLYA